MGDIDEIFLIWFTCLRWSSILTQLMRQIFLKKH